MQIQRLSWLLCCAALAGCASGPAVRVEPAAAGSASPSLRRPATPSSAPALPTSAPAVARAPGSKGAALAMSPIGDILRRVGTQSQAAADADEQRLRALGAGRSALQRVQLAYLLLDRAAPTAEQANQALELLAGLEEPGTDSGARQFVRLLQQLARQTLQLAQQRAELGRANRQVADLQDKILQIKNLEVQLQDRRKQGQTP